MQRNVKQEAMWLVYDSMFLTGVVCTDNDANSGWHLKAVSKQWHVMQRDWIFNYFVPSSILSLTSQELIGIFFAGVVDMTYEHKNFECGS